MKTDTQKRQRVAGVKPLAMAGAPLFNPFAPDTFIAHEEEDAVLACVLHQPDLFPALSAILQPADFWGLIRGFIWHAFEGLFATGVAIDVLTVAKFLDDEGKSPLKGSELLPELASIMRKAPSIENAEIYARAVRDAALRLRLMNAGAQIQLQAADQSIPIESLVDASNLAIFEATEQRAEKPTNERQLASHYYDVMERGKDTGRRGILTGFPELDRELGGIHEGEVTVLAGGAKMGKTTILLSILRHILTSGLRVALFSLEMSANEDIQRALISIHTHIPRRALKVHDLSPTQWSAFVKGIGEVGAWNLHVIDDFKSLTPLQLRRKMRTLMAVEAFDLVAIDGLWLMEPTTPDKREGRHRDVFNIMRDLTEQAADFALPILITHQYKTGTNNARPGLADLSESAGVMRNAQVIIGTSREMEHNRYVAGASAELYVLADRNGDGTGTQETVWFDGFGYTGKRPGNVINLRDFR